MNSKLFLRILKIHKILDKNKKGVGPRTNAFCIYEEIRFYNL